MLQAPSAELPLYGNPDTAVQQSMFQPHRLTAELDEIQAWRAMFRMPRRVALEW